MANFFCTVFGGTIIKIRNIGHRKRAPIYDASDLELNDDDEEEAETGSGEKEDPATAR
jgi:hypothetical protein